MVHVLDKDGKPLMSTERHGKVRRMIKKGKANVVMRSPFTMQLLYESTHYTQPVVLGVDSGYAVVGFSAVSGTKGLIAGECKLLDGQSELNKERLMCRRQRRKRYRAPRFNNREKPNGWLAPSIQHKSYSLDREDQKYSPGDRGNYRGGILRCPGD